MPIPAARPWHDDLRDAYELAYRTDPTSAYGGIIAFNRPLDADTAALILERQFVEVLVVPELLPGAAQALATKPNVRVLLTGTLQPELAAQRRTAQRRRRRAGAGSRCRTHRWRRIAVRYDAATHAEELRDLAFAWRVCKFVKSNAIVFARDEATVGRRRRPDEPRVFQPHRRHQGRGRRPHACAARSWPRMPSSRSAMAWMWPPARA